MRRILLTALAGLLFLVALAAVLGWWARPGTMAGLYAMSFAVLCLLSGWMLLRMRH